MLLGNDIANSVMILVKKIIIGLDYILGSKCSWNTNLVHPLFYCHYGTFR